MAFFGHPRGHRVNSETLVFEQHGGLTSPVDTLCRTQRLKNPTATAKDDPRGWNGLSVRHGETFGQLVWVNNVLKARAMRASEYEQAVTILQKGLDQNWASNQYLQALSDKQNSGPVYAVRSTLAANQQNAEKP